MLCTFEFVDNILHKYYYNNVFDIEQFFHLENHENIIQCYGILNYLQKTKSEHPFLNNDFIISLQKNIENINLTAPLHFFLSSLTSHMDKNKKVKVKEKLMILTKTDEDKFKNLLESIQTIKINDYKPIISIVSFNI